MSITTPMAVAVTRQQNPRTLDWWDSLGIALTEAGHPCTVHFAGVVETPSGPATRLNYRPTMPPDRLVAKAFHLLHMSINGPDHQVACPKHAGRGHATACNFVTVAGALLGQECDLP